MSFRMKVKRAAFVGDQMTAYAAAFTGSLAARHALSHVTGTEHVQKKTSKNATQQDEANPERLGRN
jgi:hypothetical protein